MDSYDDMSRVLITDDVDTQCVDMLIAQGFAVEKDIKLAKQPQEQLIKKVQVSHRSLQIFCHWFGIGSGYSDRSKCNKGDQGYY